jgi:hypothetical protein
MTAIVMTAIVVPLAAVASQTLTVTLSNQACRIDVFGKQIYVPQDPIGGIATDPPVYVLVAPVFLDLYVNNVLIIGGVLCLNEVKIVRNTYLGFIGDLYFYDTLGLGVDPLVEGLGQRWVLLYDPDLVQTPFTVDFQVSLANSAIVFPPTPPEPPIPPSSIVFLNNGGVLNLSSIPSNWPTSALGLPNGSIYANSIEVDAALPITGSGTFVAFFGDITVDELLAAGGNDLPTDDPHVVDELWINEGVVCISFGP